MAKKKYQIRLNESERRELDALVSVGKTGARKIKRANMLLLASSGKIDKDIAQLLGCHVSTVERTRKRFVSDGLDFALNEKPRPGQPVKLDGKAEAHLIALACSDPPDGRKKWTMELLAGQLVELRLVDSISDETVRLRLKKAR